MSTRSDEPLSQSYDTLPLVYARETPARTAHDLRTLADCADGLALLFWSPPRDVRGGLYWARRADIYRARARQIEEGLS